MDELYSPPLIFTQLRHCYKVERDASDLYRAQRRTCVRQHIYGYDVLLNNLYINNGENIY